MFVTYDRHVTRASDSAPAASLARTIDQEALPLEYAVAEFFAGIGLARMGLEAAGKGYKVVWANDLSSDKRDMYVGHFGDAENEHYKVEDIKIVAEDIQAAEVPTDLSLAWASFPCTDLSLAGGREGLAGEESGTFWDFTDILEALDGQKPPVVALENVNGLATSHGGDDLRAAVRRLNKLGYSVDVITLDAKRWVPQSRPRLFIIACRHVPVEDDRHDTDLRPAWLDSVLNDPSLQTHRALLPDPPLPRKDGWTEIVEDIPLGDPQWWDEARTAKFTSELSPVQQKRVESLAESGKAVYRTAYRRTREGKPAWEIRADDIAGCLRTARGGSSKQAVVRIQKGEKIRVRWMTPREYARLMGADDYHLPARRSQAIMGFGDAVCVNAIQWLATHYIEPLLSGKLLPTQRGIQSSAAETSDTVQGDDQTQSESAVLCGSLF